MDTCIKKNLVATCSSDKTVKIWSYSNAGGLNLEINQLFMDDALCVAFHPSGFNIVIGFPDGIRMMNIFKDSLVSYKNISNIKNCREIVFSNGGHLFACQNNNNVCVFKFYTADNPLNYVFKKHSGLIRRISWLADDTGFISIGWDQALFFWKLDQPEPVWTYKKGNTVDFNCLTSYKADKSEGPNDKNEPFIYVTGNDKSIRELKGFQKNPNNKDGLPEGTLKK
jgi:WD40 repeat protein